MIRTRQSTATGTRPKGYVWINGGPSSGRNKLSDGTYFFAVLEPGGQHDPNDDAEHNLSDVDPAGGASTEGCLTLTGTGCGDEYLDRLFTVSNGKISSNLGSHGESDAFSATRGRMIRAAYFDDTSNPGGVYIMAICRVDPAVSSTGGYPAGPSQCKYDAFKAPAAGAECTEHCTPPADFGKVSGSKYYDRNQNGLRDAGEPGIAGWLIDWTDGAAGAIVTDGDGAFNDLSLAADRYTFTEQQPNATLFPGWRQTGPTGLTQVTDAIGNATSKAGFVYTVDVVDGGITTGLHFGNVCRVTTRGGHTMGFWANKGQPLIDASDLAALRALSLVWEDGRLLTRPRRPR